MEDNIIENMIQEKGLEAPRVTPDIIDSLKNRVTYQTIIPEGSTTTLVIAWLDGKFRLAIGESACVDPANFDAEIGERIAKEKAERMATEQLWMSEGYNLFRQING